MLSLNLPQTFLFHPHADRRESGGRIKKRPALPKRAALNRRDHAKITCWAQRHEGPKAPISAGICARTCELFAKSLEMAVGQARQRHLPTLRVQKARGRAARDD